LIFELDKYQPKLHHDEPATPRLPYIPVLNVQKASIIYWAEHCVECAAPDCYHTCDLYEPRIDLRCRRFAFGAFKNHNFPSTRGYGVEIAFKKWAKMEAYGNLRLLPHGYALWAEKLVEVAGPVANFGGMLMARITGKPYWKAITHIGLEKLVRRLDQRLSKEGLPDAFLLEVYNPTDQTVRMQLNFSDLPAGGQPKNGLMRISEGFSTTISCTPDYSRHEVDVARLGRLVDSGRQFLISMTPEGDTNARLVFLTSEFVKFAPRVKDSDARKVKCAVFDLDNTLWKGVLIEGDDVVVSQETMKLIKLLDERGILLSIASKNDHDTAWRKLQELGLGEYFLYPQVSWNPKSQSLKTVADRLNIGIDALAFIDDNPFELDEVSRALPEVVCVNAGEMASLVSDRRFQGSATADALQRRQFYQDAATREAVQESYGSDYLGFLASCEIKLEISTDSSENSERVAELVQRTNQLNFSGRKYTRSELEQVLADRSLEKYVLKCSDRYGSYGTIGFCIVGREPDTICVQDFMLSCRVQGKLLEKAFFHHLLERHNAESARTLWINFKATLRNRPAQQVLESLGFRSCEPGANGFSQGMFLGSKELPRCDVVQVSCNCHADSVVTCLANH